MDNVTLLANSRSQNHGAFDVFLAGFLWICGLNFLKNQPLRKHLRNTNRLRPGLGMQWRSTKQDTRET